MVPNERHEFLQDLEATAEHRVRQKLNLGGYQGWQIEVVERWLDQQAKARDDERAATQLAIAQKSMFWNKVVAFGTAAGVCLAFAVYWWPKK